MKFVHFVERAYRKFVKLTSCLQSPLLLILRLHWGWAFAQGGWGKLSNLPAMYEQFAKWGVPLPHVSAVMAGLVECVGGMFLLLGLASRAAALALSFTMGVAYLTAEREALNAIWSDPDKFTDAASFLFMLVALIVLAFGPGMFSLDWLIGWIWRKKRLGVADGK